jgi:Protein of unknown function (DUF3987)
MKKFIDFLNAIRHTDRVYIRCISPKNTPLPELAARGMTYKDKSGTTKKSTVNGYIELETGIFYRRYGTEYKPVIDGWGHLLELNQQGYGVYFVVGHGGERNNDITHGSTLFHESDRATLEQQQLEIDRISLEFGKPNAVVKTKKSLHVYWASSATIPVEHLATYQRRWLQYSNCDDSSLADPAQLMRLPGFDHVAWNGTDFDRVQCELLQLNNVSYSLEQFDKVLPSLDVSRWCKQSISELTESDADDRDIRTLAQYLTGFDSSGVKWIKAKCPAHGGESSDSLHIDSETGGFICHAGCSSSAVYNAAKAVAVAAGHRFEVVDKDESLKESITKALDLKNCEAPILFGGDLGRLLKQTARNLNERLEIFNFISIPVLASRIKSETCLIVNMGFAVKPVRWCGLVGGTGTMKSPILNTVIKPLDAEQIEIWKRYLTDTEVYESSVSDFNKLSKDEQKENDEPKHPKNMQSLYYSDFTIESLIAGVSDYRDEGAIIYSDELAGFFNSMDAYKSSAGVDRPKWLSIWDGGAIKCNRRSGSSYVPHSSISIIGGIQPGIIEGMIKKDKSKSDGLWARFTFMRIDHKLVSLFTTTEGSLGETLSDIYKRLASEPAQQHTIDVNARPLCTAWHEFLHQRIKDEGDNNPLMVGIYAKMIGITFRNALILHRVYAAISNTTPTQTVPVETIATAIAWTKFEMNQTLMEYQMLGLTDDNDPELARILKFINKFGGSNWLVDHPDGWVSARDVTRWWSPKPKPKPVDVRKFMSKIVDLGNAISNDEYVESPKFKIKLLLEKSGANGAKNDKTYADRAVEVGTTENINVVTKDSDEWVYPLPTEDCSFGTTKNIEVVPKIPKLDTSSDNERYFGTIGTTCHHADLESGARVKALQSNDFSNVGTIGTTFSHVNENKFKIGDRAKLGDEIFTIDKIEGDYICGHTSDGSCMGGHINLFESLADVSPATPTKPIPEATEEDGY